MLLITIFVALTGTLMCGLSTAFFFIIVSKKILQRMDERSKI
jgi:hypothetical protein